MRQVNLAEDLAGVDEQNLIVARRAALASIEEPQSHWQRDRVKKVGADCHYDVDGKVHLAETNCLVDTLLPVNGQPSVLAVAMLVYEASALYKHAAGAARWI